MRNIQSAFGRNIFKTINWKLLLPAILLSLLGMLSIYSSSLNRGDFLNLKKQALFLFLSLLIVIFLSAMDLRFLKNNSYLIFTLYCLSLISLLGLLFLSQAHRGTKGWYNIGPVSFDPEPFAALALIIVLSKYFASRHIEIHSFKAVIVSGIYAFLPFLLVLGQPDLGSSLSLVCIWLGMLLFSGIKIKHLLVIFLLFAVCFVLAWNFYFKDYHKQRIMALLNPHFDEKGIAWSTNQSKIAIGNGGWWGKGIGRGTQTQYGFLSEPKTDFIFSAIAEEFGFFAVLTLFVLFIILLWQILCVIKGAQNNFLRLFAFGFAFLLVSQIAVNIGMCLGILPVIGIPLPFVSYSGSSITAFYLGLAILMSLQKKSE